MVQFHNSPSDCNLKILCMKDFTTRTNCFDHAILLIMCMNIQINKKKYSTMLSSYSLVSFNRDSEMVSGHFTKTSRGSSASGNGYFSYNGFANYTNHAGRICMH